MEDELKNLPLSLKVVARHNIGLCSFRTALIYTMPPGKHLVKWQRKFITLPLPYVVLVVMVNHYGPPHSYYYAWPIGVYFAKSAQPRKLYIPSFTNIYSEYNGRVRPCLSRSYDKSITSAVTSIVDRLLGAGFNEDGAKEYARYAEEQGLNVHKWQSMSVNDILQFKFRKALSTKELKADLANVVLR